MKNSEIWLRNLATAKLTPQHKYQYLELTEVTNAIDYLNRVKFFAEEALNDPTAWKWVIISLHGALYGFAISALVGTNYDRVLSNRKKRGNDKGIRKAKPHLIPFNEAIRRCQDPNWMEQNIFSKILTLTIKQKKSIRLLQEVLRNNFEHFVPKSWVIDLYGMPEVSINVLNVIRFLAVDSRNCYYHTQSQIKTVKSLVFQSKRILKSHPLYVDRL